MSRKLNPRRSRPLAALGFFTLLGVASGCGDGDERSRSPGRESGQAEPSSALLPFQSSSGHLHRARAAAETDEPAQFTVQVRAGAMRFEPRAVEVPAGVPIEIELVNEDDVEHAIVVPAPGGGVDWIHLHAAAGSSARATHRFDRPGHYPLGCTIPGHLEAGMLGELVVTDP